MTLIIHEAKKDLTCWLYIILTKTRLMKSISWKQELHLFQVMKIDLNSLGNLLPMMNCELFIFPSNNFLILF